MIGERIGNWIIDAEIGKNEMGRVFRARADDDPTRLAAVKWLTHPKAKTPEFEKLFLAQVDLLRKLKHPGIVEVLDGGIHHGSPYFVTEWVEGTDFETILRGGENVRWQEVLAIALQIVPALRHAHRRSVLHRDLKPSNLFRCGDGKYKLSDFGVTKFFGDVLLTSADNMLGSASYLSPEQAAGKPHSKRGDFYSLGCLLYTLIVGRPPFTGGTVVELIHKHCHTLPERPTHFVRDLPDEIDRFIVKLLAKDPSQRPGSGTLLIHEIGGIWSVLERRGRLPKRPVSSDVPDDGIEIPVDEEAIAALEAREAIPREPVSWQRRWYIVAPLFFGCVLLLMWAFFWRGPSAEELIDRARPLMASERPADWDKAWHEYLEPLSRKYPDKFSDEVNDARRKIDENGELRKAFLTGKNAKFNSEAERFYHEGLRLVQSGEFASARRVWDNLIRAYDNVEAENRWVSMAREGITRIEQRGGNATRPSANPEFAQLVGPAIEEIQRLRRKGKTKEAEAVAQALEFLYRDDPEIERLRKMLAPTMD